MLLTQWRRQDFVTGGGESVPVVLSVYQRGSLLDGLAMYLSCDTKKFRDNKSTRILHNFWTSTHRGKLRPFPPGGATVLTSRIVVELRAPAGTCSSDRRGRSTTG